MGLKGCGGGGRRTEGRAVKGTASALRFNPDTSAIVGFVSETCGLQLKLSHSPCFQG